MTEASGRNLWFTHFASSIAEEDIEEQWTLNFNYSLEDELDARKRAEASDFILMLGRGTDVTAYYKTVLNALRSSWREFQAWNNMFFNNTNYLALVTFNSFTCRRCSNSWSSSRATMVFHYRLGKKKGFVLLRLLRQQCRECDNPIWHKPQVYSNQIYQVLDRLIPKILKNCYGVPNLPDITRKMNLRKTKPHESSLCEACEVGICNQS